MLKSYALRLHRWITLAFALPLAVVIGTGLLLSFEPLALQAKLDSPLTAETLLGHLRKHDPDGKATAVSIRSYEQALILRGVGRDGEIEIDLSTGDAMLDDGGFAWSEAFSVARGLHERLLFDLGWLVTASTWAMLALAALGLLMGWPRFRQTFGGWHVGSAWIMLPLVVLSPLSGLALAYGVTFAGSAPSPRAERVSIARAVELIGERHDLANLTSLRPRGGRLVARIFEGGALNAFVVGPGGLEPQPRNWPRAIHEGNWSGTLAPALNILVSVVFMGLLGTGLFIWARRTLRQKRRRALNAVALRPAE